MTSNWGIPKGHFESPGNRDQNCEKCQGFASGVGGLAAGGTTCLAPWTKRVGTCLLLVWVGNIMTPVSLEKRPAIIFSPL